MSRLKLLAAVALRRLRLMGLIGAVLYVLGHVQVHVPVCGPMPVLAFIACAEAGLLAVIAAGIIRSLRGSSRRAAW